MVHVYSGVHMFYSIWWYVWLCMFTLFSCTAGVVCVCLWLCTLAMHALMDMPHNSPLSSILNVHWESHVDLGMMSCHCEWGSPSFIPGRHHSPMTPRVILLPSPRAWRLGEGWRSLLQMTGASPWTLTMSTCYCKVGCSEPVSRRGAADRPWGLPHRFLVLSCCLFFCLICTQNVHRL